MKEIVEALKKRISENKNSMLVTVVAGRGSIPRKAGAYMVVGEDGRVTGTIGGGNLEYQATLLGQKLLTEKKNYLHEYNLGQEKSAELGMACGIRIQNASFFSSASSICLIHAASSRASTK